MSKIKFDVSVSFPLRLVKDARTYLMEYAMNENSIDHLIDINNPKIKGIFATSFKDDLSDEKIIAQLKKMIASKVQVFVDEEISEGYYYESALMCDWGDAIATKFGKLEEVQQLKNDFKQKNSAQRLKTLRNELANIQREIKRLESLEE